MGNNRAIGSKNGLLWHIPQELKRFKEITTGHPIIMGRKTHESIGKVLPNRTNIVITKDENYQAQGCLIVHSLEEALRLASLSQGNNECFVIGGGQIYEQALPLADKLYLTVVEGDFSQADTFFPDDSDFKKTVFEQEAEDAGFKFKFLEMER
ncbi:MAG: dihydrofolate reductase [Patescibacteria group bacterium]|nr:dihydrofolate reductase [Patescibacteria group bacterium]